MFQNLSNIQLHKEYFRLMNNLILNSKINKGKVIKEDEKVLILRIEKIDWRTVNTLIGMEQLRIERSG